MTGPTPRLVRGRSSAHGSMAEKKRTDHYETAWPLLRASRCSPTCSVWRAIVTWCRSRRRHGRRCRVREASRAGVANVLSLSCRVPSRTERQRGAPLARFLILARRWRAAVRNRCTSRLGRRATIRHAVSWSEELARVQSASRSVFARLTTVWRAAENEVHTTFRTSTVSTPRNLASPARNTSRSEEFVGGIPGSLRNSSR